MTAKGRITTSNVTEGTRLILAIDGNGRLAPTGRKTGQLVTVEAISAEMVGGGRKAQRRYELRTDKGLVSNLAPAQTLTLAPEAPAAVEVPEVTNVEVDGTVVATTRRIKTPAAKAAAKAAPKAAPAEAKAPRARAPKAKAAATLPAGYTIKWPHGGYDLARKDDKAAEGAAWLVICNDHGTTTEAANAKEGDALGNKAGRRTWCKACKAA